MTDTTPEGTWVRNFNLFEVVPVEATRDEIAHHASRVRAMLIASDLSDFATDLRGVLKDCESRLVSTLAELIEAHRATEAAVEAASDEEAPELYDALVEARIELLAYCPQCAAEAREKAAYVRASPDCTDDEFGEPVIIALVDRLCEFRPA